MLKISDKKCCAYVLMIYVLTKSLHGKPNTRICFFLPNNVKLEKFAFLYSLRLLVVSGVGFSSHNGRFDVKTSLGGFPDAVATRLCFLSPLSYTICIALVISILINERSRSLVKNIYNLFFVICYILGQRS